jgi:predicted HTH domain antitoxin
MPTKSITLKLPTTLAQELGAASQEFLVDVLERGLRELKIERALEQYSRGGISFGAAARQASVSQSELARRAFARGMEPLFSNETLAEICGTMADSNGNAASELRPPAHA